MARFHRDVLLRELRQLAHEYGPLGHRRHNFSADRVHRCTRAAADEIEALVAQLEDCELRVVHLRRVLAGNGPSKPR